MPVFRAILSARPDLRSGPFIINFKLEIKRPQLEALFGFAVVYTGGESDREAASARCVSVLRRDDSGHGRREPVEVLLRAFLFQDQAQIQLLRLRQTFGCSINRI
ncbi:hypothetical protein Ddye_007928 [Dipteronia dyeriana]|uniref:Uncharacterized protein n=1 Tax=Dipteronia dyeriana TaxID=168575 RepID=A0AAD9XKY9_9ROSI|nr:hypothetical protein Ddye_007928 [Dipteronia dyeriana]